MNDSSRPCLLPRIIGGPQAETLPEGCSPLIDGGSLPCPGAVTRLEAISGLDEDGEPLRIRSWSAAYAEQALALRAKGADLLLAEGIRTVPEARAVVLGARQAGVPVLLSAELDDEGCTPEGIPFAAILASVQHLGAAAVGFRCGGDRIDTLTILGQHAAYATVPLMPVLRSRERSPEEVKRHATQALKAGADLFLLGPRITASQREAAAQAVAEFSPEEQVIPLEEDLLFMACEAEAFFLPDGGLTFSEPIPCQYDMGPDILAAEATGCDVLSIYVDSPEDAEYFADNAHMIRLPVCIISHDEIALESALMEYNGRAFVDLQSELPDSELYTLARGYGAVVL